MAVSRSYTIIINPTAGGRRGARRVRQLLKQSADGDIEVLTTHEPGQAHHWAMARRARSDHVVVAAGGDGTVHEVGTALIHAAASMAVLPLGSGNDFAYAIRQGWEDRGVTAWAHWTPRRVDAAQVEILQPTGAWQSHAFVNSIGLGIEGAIAALAPRLPLVYGFGRYMLAALIEAWRYQAPTLRLTIDGQCCEGHQLLLAIGNGPRAGGGFVLHPDARLDDGQLDLCRVGALSRFHRARLLPSVIAGRHQRHPEVISTRLRAIEVVCPSGVPVHCDGEVVATAARQVNVCVQPAALKLLAPPPAATGPRHPP